MKYLIILLAFSIQAQELLPSGGTKAKAYIHYGYMYLAEVKTVGSGFVNNVPTPVRNAEYLHEVYKNKHHWNFDSCKGTRGNKLDCSSSLSWGETENMFFKWRIRNKNLTETITYWKDGSMIRAVWKGSIKRKPESYFEWDLGNLGF